MSLPALIGTDSADLLGVGGASPVPVAVFLRTSTRDLQDPTLSLPRQLDNCRKVLPNGFVIVAFFYDVESSRKDLELRGLGNAHEAFDIPIPRDGGLADLMAEARHPNRRFEAVVVEEIERAARWTHQSTQLEHELEKVGVPLFAADEGPISLSEKRATQILVRRMKQGVAEWFLRHTLEQSWEGFREHTFQGWNIGKACHGYLNEKVPHPVAAKREEGRTKSRLIVDPERAPAVVRIYQWRHDEKLAYKVIADRLNADPDRYPPPQPNSGTRARGRWTPSSVRELLINPKYTGHMVWNRRASKKGGIVNPPEKWIWSPEPTHEPLVTREMWDAVQQNRTARQGSRMNGRNSHPDTHRTYVLRYFVHHKQCNKRMFGKTRKGNGYYTCQPKLDLVGKPEEYADHPRSVYVREDALLECLEKFFNERVLGPDRTTLLRHQLRGQSSSKGTEIAQRITAIEKTVAEITRRQDNILDERESRPITSGDDLADAWAERLRRRYAELEQQRRTKNDELKTLREQAARQQPDEPALLEDLPRLALHLTRAPDVLQRDLYEAFGIKIVYDHTTKHVTIYATLTAETLPAAVTAVGTLSPATPTEPAPVPPPARGGGGTGQPGTTWATTTVAHVLRAPGRNRTCDLGIRRPLLYPTELRRQWHPPWPNSAPVSSAKSIATDQQECWGRRQRCPIGSARGRSNYPRCHVVIAAPLRWTRRGRRATGGSGSGCADRQQRDVRGAERRRRGDGRGRRGDRGRVVGGAGPQSAGYTRSGAVDNIWLARAAGGGRSGRRDDRRLAVVRRVPAAAPRQRTTRGRRLPRGAPGRRRRAGLGGLRGAAGATDCLGYDRAAGR